MTAPLVHVSPHTLPDGEREAMDRLSRVHGPGELRAALLACLLTPGSQRERRAWREETRGLSTARALRADVKQLGPASRLPWFERLMARLATVPLGDRQSVMEAARRVMSADGLVRPIDRLHWLALRHRLGGPIAVSVALPDAGNDLSQLSLHSLREIARVTAFLSRMVPGGDAPQQAGADWYRAVMLSWLPAPSLPEGTPPDADGLVNALADVQSLPWMLRPVLVRAWIDAAWRALPGPQRAWPEEAADALRLAALLLDCPLPPELARHYVPLP
jgi:hypothetical protein